MEKMKVRKMWSIPIRVIFKFILLVSLFILIVLLFHHVNYYAPVPQYISSHRKFSIQLTGFEKSEVNSSEILENISKNIPNLPFEYWTTVEKQAMFLNRSCARITKLFDVKINNDYWQTLKTSNGTFQLLNAYYDNRKNKTFKPTIRILGMLDRIDPTVKTYCQLWFHNITYPTIVNVSEYKYLWNSKWGYHKSGIYHAYFLRCEIPKQISTVPAMVSLVEQPCDTSTVGLKVIYNKPEMVKNFAVCVKGLNYPYLDKSVRLIEWMELLYILGADKIFFYNLDAHPNILKTLNYYERKNKAHVTPLTLAGEQPNSHPLQFYYLSQRLIFKRQNEVIPYNDCFYKHMYEYKYIVLLDIDEVIIPVMNQTWRELLDVVEEKAKTKKILERASFNVQNVYFLDDLLHDHGWFRDIPKHMHMLQHVFRSKNFTKPGAYIKSFFNTDKTMAVHNHYPFACLGYCFSYAINNSYAQLQHYRSDCVKELKKFCVNYRNSSVEDTTIWKYKDVLIKEVNNTLNEIGFSIKDSPD